MSPLFRSSNSLDRGAVAANQFIEAEPYARKTASTSGDGDPMDASTVARRDHRRHEPNFGARPTSRAPSVHDQVHTGAYVATPLDRAHPRPRPGHARSWRRASWGPVT